MEYLKMNKNVAYLSSSLYNFFNVTSVIDLHRSRHIYTSDTICSGSASMTLYYYMCKSWQDCCRKWGNRTWPSVSVESVDSTDHIWSRVSVGV